jgi:hypothetical protein
VSFIDDQLASALDSIIAMNPATLEHGENSYQVYKSYGPAGMETIGAVGFLGGAEELSVIIKTADLATPHPKLDEVVTLDGDEYLVGPRIVKTASYWWITLSEVR